MARSGNVPSPSSLGTSLFVKTLKKKSSWFRCNAGDFDDDCPRIAPEPFISLPVDPFARYTIPSQRKGVRPRTPILHFPSPPPRSPVSYCQRPLPSPPHTPAPPTTPTTPTRPFRGDCTAVSTQRHLEEFRSKLVDAKLASLTLGCTGYSDELEETERRRQYERATTDDWSERETIFTLFGEAKEWEEFEDALFYLKPSRSTSFNSTHGLAPSTAPSSLPSSLPSSSSLACSSSSSASSLYSAMTTPDTTCRYSYI